MENQLLCPKCGSNHLSSNKQGFTLMTGVIGMNNIKITCLSCGKSIKPGEAAVSLEHVKLIQKAEKNLQIEILLPVILTIILSFLIGPGGFFMGIFIFFGMALRHVVRMNKIKKMVGIKN